jgi:hypothetical protein
MTKPRNRSRLTLEALAIFFHFFAGDAPRIEHFHSGITVEFIVESSVNARHAALTEDARDFVIAKLFAN